MIPKKNNRLDSIQIVRAFAMLLVLIIHADVFSTRILNTPFLFNFFYPGGDSGVDLFFVVSGFIIFYIHQGDINQKIKFIPYLIKRFARIFPTYWAVNMLVIPLHFFFRQYGLGDETTFHKIFFSLFLLPQQGTPIIHAAWTLSYEILFYFCFGLIIWFGYKKILPLIIFIITGTILGWIYSLQNITQFQNSYFNLIFGYYNFEFLLGCISAYLVTNIKIKQPKILLSFGILLFILMIGLEKYSSQALYSLRLFGYGFPSFLIITSLSSSEINGQFKITKNLVSQFLLLLGNASFSIYLTHQILISAIGRGFILAGLPNIISPYILIFIIIAIAVTLGCIFHLIIEKPLVYHSRTKLLNMYNKRLN